MSNNTSKIDLPAIRARCSQSITEIVDNPREYYRVQQILRDRSDLLAEADRLRAALEAVKRHIEAAEGIEVAFRAAKHFAAAYNAADEALAGSQHETNACQHDWTPQVKDIWCCEKCGRFERRGPCPDR